MSSSPFPEVAPPADGTGGEQSRPALLSLVQSREWRRALAVTRVVRMHPLVQYVFEQLETVQLGVRSRRYLLARRAVEEYAGTLDQLGTLPEPLSPEELEAISALRLEHRPEVIADGLAALEAAQKNFSTEVLAPALGSPFTRAEALNIQGVQAVRDEQDAQARALFEEALVADPGHYRAISNIGNLHMDAQEYAQAETLYRRVIELSPEFDVGHHNLGVALRRQGQVRAGVKAIRKGQQLALRKSQQDSRLEIEEQVRRNPSLKVWRVVVPVAILLAVVLSVVL